MIYHKPRAQSSTGFALLLALVVVSVVVSVGLTVLELTMKQVRLSTNSKESELAFHAANAGLECARYWRVAGTVDMEAGNPIAMNCFNQPENVTPDLIEAGVFTYQTEFTWGQSAASRCSKMKTLVIVSDVSATTTVSSMETLIPGYPYGGNKDCEPGGRCTVISVQGYSSACGNIGTIGTVEREVLLEL